MRYASSSYHHGSQAQALSGYRRLRRLRLAPLVICAIGCCFGGRFVNTRSTENLTTRLILKFFLFLLFPALDYLELFPPCLLQGLNLALPSVVGV